MVEYVIAGLLVGLLFIASLLALAIGVRGALGGWADAHHYRPGQRL
jgi:hypothetical protein